MAGKPPPRATVRWQLVRLDDLYRDSPWPKPRKGRRIRRRAAARYAAMSPAERALRDFLVAELRAGLAAKEDAQILHGSGEQQLTGLF